MYTRQDHTWLIKEDVRFARPRDRNGLWRGKLPDLQRKSIAHYLQIIKIMSPAAGEGVTQPEVVFEKQIAVLLAKYLKAANGGDTLRKLH